MIQASDDRPERSGWHVTRGRTPDGRFGWITLTHHGRSRPPLTLRQIVARATVLDALLAALCSATLMRMGQRDALSVGLAALPLAIVLWTQWNSIRAARRSS